MLDCAASRRWYLMIYSRRWYDRFAYWFHHFSECKIIIYLFRHYITFSRISHWYALYSSFLLAMISLFTERLSFYRHWEYASLAISWIIYVAGYSPPKSARHGIPRGRIAVASSAVVPYFMLSFEAGYSGHATPPCLIYAIILEWGARYAFRHIAPRF